MSCDDTCARVITFLPKIVWRVTYTLYIIQVCLSDLSLWLLKKLLCADFHDQSIKFGELFPSDLLIELNHQTCGMLNAKWLIFSIPKTLRKNLIGLNSTSVHFYDVAEQIQTI